MSHISERLTDAQVITILTQYEEDKLSAADAQAKLSIKPSRFFDYVQRFRKDKSSFTVARVKGARKSRISADATAHIKEELEKERDLIKNPSITIRFYNYSAVRDVLKEQHDVDLSVPTIIRRAKELGYYIPKGERVKHDPQWKATLKRCGSDVIYALSPQAKGKVERPYRWIQDRLVRTAAKEKLTTIDELKEVLRHLIEMYNSRWVHSTTKEIPIVRFENALNGNCSLFKPLSIATPDKDRNDLFCLTFKRATDGYRSLSFDGVLFRLPNARSYTETEIHIAPDLKHDLAIFRFWQNGSFVEEHKIKLLELKALRF